MRRVGDARCGWSPHPPAWGNPTASEVEFQSFTPGAIQLAPGMLSAHALRRAAIPCFASSCRRHASTTTARALERFQDGNPDWTETQRMVREATAKICEKYDDDYWLSVDRSARFPTERKPSLPLVTSFNARGLALVLILLFCCCAVVTADLAQGGWLGICMPEEVSRPLILPDVFD
jgi:hypothetical protein